jgi:hypothetical protein
MGKLINLFKNKAWRDITAADFSKAAITAIKKPALLAGF